MNIFRAYAKINLGLRVRGKRPDGYHDIETVFHRVDLFDTLSITPSKVIEVMSDDPSAPSDERNICHKAARMLQDELGIREGARIEIRKNIPTGAGLGGGSADAAVVIRELPSLWGKSLDITRASNIALALGSDVPYFLQQGSAVGRGRGEILEYFSLSLPFTILLCNPRIHVATPWAYRQVIPRGNTNGADFRTILEKGSDSPRTFEGSLVNDFEEPVFREYPVIRQVKETMGQQGALFSLMSGSGSTVFGLFDSPEKSANTGELFSSKGYRVFLTGPGFTPA